MDTSGINRETTEGVLLEKASENVETYRKGNGTIQFKTPSGEPLAGVEIQVTQKSQDFLFGNLIFDLLPPESPYKPELFKQRFLELFNLAIFPFYWTTY